MKWREFSGKTVKEAIETACDELKCDETLLEIDVVQEGAKGFLGLVGQRDALIKVKKRDILKEVMEVEPKESSNGPRRQTSEPRRNRKDTADADDSVAQRQAPQPNEKPDEQTPREENTVPFKADLSEEEASTLTEASELLSDILKRMDIEAEVNPRMMGSAAYLDIKGDGSGLLIGKRGQTLDALQFVVNKIINKPDRRKDKVEVIVDTENYRLRRREQFREKAIRKCRQAKKSLKPVSFEPMPAYERRLVHMILSDDREIYTRSVGEGHRRHVIVYPKKGSQSKRRRR